MRGHAVWKVALAYLTRRTVRIFPAYYLLPDCRDVVSFRGSELRQHPVFILDTSIMSGFHYHNWGLIGSFVDACCGRTVLYYLGRWVILLFQPDTWLRFFGLWCGKESLSDFHSSLSRLRFHCSPCWYKCPVLAWTHLQRCFTCLLSFQGFEKNPWLKWASLAAIPFCYFWLLQINHRSFIALDRLFLFPFLRVTLVDAQ